MMHHLGQVTGESMLAKAQIGVLLENAKFRRGHV